MAEAQLRRRGGLARFSCWIGDKQVDYYRGYDYVDVSNVSDVVGRFEMAAWSLPRVAQ